MLKYGKKVIIFHAFLLGSCLCYIVAFHTFFKDLMLQTYTIGWARAYYLIALPGTVVSLTVIIMNWILKGWKMQKFKCNKVYLVVGYILLFSFIALSYSTVNKVCICWYIIPGILIVFGIKNI